MRVSLFGVVKGRKSARNRSFSVEIRDVAGTFRYTGLRFRRPPGAQNQAHISEANLAKEPALPKDIAALSFEDALKELEGIVQQLERGQVKLDEAISAYERGALLKRHCEQRLAEAKMKVEKIVFSADGSVSTQSADLG
ncbi:MAG: exodeoxyribonuclease VII small subunit [Reyranella sp.]|nr:exodeoxyribonuclease VII small subunit [Alphaproteobacteria bacterium]MBR2817487.1 exodeoxyribonuclease VII small subunit [Reyranella sp.]